jgi:hypothetical protein
MWEVEGGVSMGRKGTNDGTAQNWVGREQVMKRKLAYEYGRNLAHEYGKKQYACDMLYLCCSFHG